MAKQNSKKNDILLAAKKIFTSKGFDGTSVDEIAKEAGITKSLLYYYFESKDDIFYELTKITMENLVIRLGEERKTAVPTNREEVFQSGIKILESELDVLRISVSEALKTPAKTSIIFQLPALVFDEFSDKYHYTSEEKALFCMNAINIITYLSFKEKIGEVFEINSSTVAELFKKSV